MKPVRHIILFILSILLFYSCSRSEEAVVLPELVEADSLMYVSPDSALQLLQQMPPPSSSHPLQQATWALLLTQARYKCFVEQDDSLLNLAAGYFMKGDDARRRALVLYLKACLLDGQEQAEEKQKYLLEADREVTAANDARLGYVINLSLANNYAYRSLFDYGFQAARKALAYATDASLQREAAFAHILYGRLYGAKGQAEQSEALLEKSDSCYAEALTLAAASGDEELQAIGMRERAAVCCVLQRYDQAIPLLKAEIAISRRNKVLPAQSFLILGETYSYLQMYDSAFFYLEKALDADNIYTQHSAYTALFNLCNSLQKYADASRYAHNLLQCNDSIHKIEKNRMLVEMQAKHDKQQVVDEKNALEVERNRMMIILVIVVLLGDVMVFLYQRHRLLADKALRKKESLIRRSNERIRENEREISRNLQRIQELSDLSQDQDSTIAYLQARNSTLDAENKRLQDGLEHSSALLDDMKKDAEQWNELLGENDRLRARERSLCEMLINGSETLRRLRFTDKSIKEDRWDEIKDEVNRIFNGFTERLLQQCPSLTRGDLRLSILIKLHLPSAQIASLLGVSTDSVYKSKNRLKERILRTCEPWKPEYSLDTWLWDF